MKTNIHGNKLEITESIKSYIIEKLGKLDKYIENSSLRTDCFSIGHFLLQKWRCRMNSESILFIPP